MTGGPHPRFARTRANPTLESLEYIQAALTATAQPVSRNQLLALLASWGHAMNRRSVNSALEFFASLGAVQEDSRGLTWVAPGGRGGPMAPGRPASRSGLRG